MASLAHMAPFGDSVVVQADTMIVVVVDVDREKVLSSVDKLP